MIVYVYKFQLCSVINLKIIVLIGFTVFIGLTLFILIQYGKVWIDFIVFMHFIYEKNGRIYALSIGLDSLGNLWLHAGGQASREWVSWITDKNAQTT